MGQHKSKFLDETHLNGLNKVGDLMIPGDTDLPSFSKTGCVEHVDRILNFTEKADLQNLKMLLMVMSLLPNRINFWILVFLEWVAEFEWEWLGLFREVRIGLKSLVMSLYYSGLVGADFSGKTSHEILGYQVGVYTDDLK